MKPARKTSCARVLVVGGSKDYSGAVFLAGIAALRAGAGSVLVMAPEKVAWALNALSPDLVTRKLRGDHLSFTHLREIQRQLKTADILVVGNGTGVRGTTAKLMRTLMRWSGPKVIDADALKILRMPVENAILTPNTGEWHALEKHVGVSKLLRAGNVVVKKGSPTRIFAAGKALTIRTNRGLSKAGTGDVLAGLCAGHLARGLPLFHAAQAACRIGNEIADVLTKRKRGYYFLASDIAEELKRVRA